MDYEDLCKIILDSDTDTRFAAVYHLSGEKLAGGFCNGKSPFTKTEKEFHASISAAILATNTHRMLEEFFGKQRYSLLEFERLKGFIFPLEEDLILIVTLEPVGNHCLALERILSILKVGHNSRSILL